ncbi:unnamed protein product [Chilo suppressalis]|uniref:H(+)-exporting diphosphatase n=1 Tax=Chilo suppressalis TaxID=168631 RepID=A0ABN8B9Z8_CHISP|nr:unnamed protein product [Chilo suppressalis]
MVYGPDVGWGVYLDLVLDCVGRLSGCNFSARIRAPTKQLAEALQAAASPLRAPGLHLSLRYRRRPRRATSLTTSLRRALFPHLVDALNSSVSSNDFKMGFGNVINSIPVFGHIKAGVHMLTGNPREAAEATHAANRSTAAVAGGAATAVVVGPIGMIFGAIAAGTTVYFIYSLANNSAVGVFDELEDTDKDICKNEFPRTSLLKTGLHVGADALSGATGGNVAANIPKALAAVVVGIAGVLAKAFDDSARSATLSSSPAFRSLEAFAAPKYPSKRNYNEERSVSKESSSCVRKMQARRSQRACSGPTATCSADNSEFCSELDNVTRFRVPSHTRASSQLAAASLLRAGATSLVL